MPIEINDQKIAVLYQYWCGKRNGRRFPSRQDIDPAEIPKLLPNIFLVDVLNDPLDFRYRLSGSEVDAIHGQPMTGKMVGEIASPEISELVLRQYRQVIETGEPLCATVRLIGRDARYWHYERIILPLGIDGIGVDMLLCAACIA